MSYLKRLKCSLFGHEVLPVRFSCWLGEWRCTHCGQRLISYLDPIEMKPQYVGRILPRAHYEGMIFTVMKADTDTDRILGDVTKP